MRFLIYDWAGNKPFGNLFFDSFEDAWGHIYEWIEKNKPEEEFDQWCNEYWVG